VGEESVKELFGGSFEERRAVVIRLGMAGDVAERIAAGMDDGMGRAVLTLLRSAAQPVMAEAGRGLADARRRRGLALLAMRDVGIDGSNGTEKQHRAAAEAAGAEIAELADVGHWWPVENARPAAAALRQPTGSGRSTRCSASPTSRSVSPRPSSGRPSKSSWRRSGRA
jgi:hypothetical protein